MPKELSHPHIELKEYHSEKVDKALNNTHQALGVVRQGYFVWLFSIMTKPSLSASLFKTPPGQFIFFPISAGMAVFSAIFSLVQLYRAKKRTAVKVTDTGVNVVSALLTATAVIGGLATTTAFALVTPILLVASMAINSVYNGILSTYNAYKWRTAPSEGAAAKEIKAAYKSAAIQRAQGAVLGGALTVGFGLMMLGGILPTAMAILCSVVSAVGFGLTVFGIIKKTFFSNKKAPSPKEKPAAEEDSLLPDTAKTTSALAYKQTTPSIYDALARNDYPVKIQSSLRSNVLGTHAMDAAKERYREFVELIQDPSFTPEQIMAMAKQRLLFDVQSLEKTFKISSEQLPLLNKITDFINGDHFTEAKLMLVEEEKNISLSNNPDMFYLVKAARLYFNRLEKNLTFNITHKDASIASFCRP